MKHGSLFSGIGGFDLAAEWVGWENLFHCEINPFCQKVLKYYWPDAISYHDIKETDFTIWRGKLDILTGGFPCQPYSTAGKRKGTEDDRHLWPEMLRAIREIKPQYIVGENVRGLVTWNEGLVFEQVQVDLENEGYEVQAVILPACSVNAPHRRDRVWFVAYNTNARVKGMRPEWENPIYGFKSFTNTSGSRLERFTGTGIQRRSARPSKQSWSKWPTQSPLCSRDDGFSSELDGITFPKWRSESIKGFGNAVVPQLVYQIFKAIEETDRLYNT